MKRHVQVAGVRYWSGDDLVELQSESLNVVEGFFSQFDNMIISGCKVVNGDTLKKGLVALNGLDPDNNPVYKVAPVEAATGLTFPVYLTLKCEVIEREYGDGNMKPVKEVYIAELSTVKPGAGVSYLTIYENNSDNKRFADNIRPGSRKITLNNIHSSAEKGWTVKAAMLTARQGLSLAAFDDKIYAIGGAGNGGIAVATNECYDPMTDSWTTKAVMPTARRDLGVTEIGSKIYAIGGYSGGSYFAINECHDPITDSWTTKAAMPTARHGLDTAVIDGKIYAVGGYTAGNYLTTNECYNPITDAWTAKAAMPTARQGFSTAVIDGKIYAIGGINSSGIIAINECYDPITDTWTAKAEMPTARQVFCTAVIDGKIYAIGGISKKGVIATNECYDPITDSWTTEEIMPTARYGLGAVVVAGKLYTIGGVLDSIVISQNECYINTELKQLVVCGNSQMRFDKNVLWNKEFKPANVFFETFEPGTLSFIETDVSGEIDESFDITYNSL